MKLVNFEDTNTTAKIINAEVIKTTEGKITSIVNPSDLSGVRFALINAIYFKGNWNVQFKRKNSKTIKFTDDSGKRNLGNITLMVIEGETFNYG